MDDHRAMRAAIEGALPSRGTTWPNPTVGCALVRGAEVVARGVTSGPGGLVHAEEGVLAVAGNAARGATAFVTFEPCGARRSGAPSCADLLVRAGIARVVIALEDPSPFASGRGLARLRDAGIEIDVGVLRAEAGPLSAGFRHRVLTGRPLVELADEGTGFDAELALRDGEDVVAALERLGREGYTRVWARRELRAALGPAAVLDANAF